MNKIIDQLLLNWKKRNIEGAFFPDRVKAREKILELVPKNASIGFSGSMTLDALGIIRILEDRGNRVFNPYQEGLSRGESLEIRRQGAAADYFFASPNALSQAGELVFFSAYGNRIAGVSYAGNVILAAGKNKIAPNIEEALKRARDISAPLNCKRLNWSSACSKDGLCHKDACFAPEYKRMCCQSLVIEAEVALGRLKVFLINEDLGF